MSQHPTSHVLQRDTYTMSWEVMQALASVQRRVPIYGSLPQFPTRRRRLVKPLGVLQAVGSDPTLVQRGPQGACPQFKFPLVPKNGTFWDEDYPFKHGSDDVESTEWIRDMSPSALAAAKAGDTMESRQTRMYEPPPKYYFFRDEPKSRSSKQ